MAVILYPHQFVKQTKTVITKAGPLMKIFLSGCLGSGNYAQFKSEICNVWNVLFRTAIEAKEWRTEMDRPM